MLTAPRFATASQVVATNHSNQQDMPIFPKRAPVIPGMARPEHLPHSRASVAADGRGTASET